uniref:Uncharacterized protein n=1 Tax=Cyanothece sp. (strain PCC 7425 / ATCC 29141) TaxID=395961 RepID=B8HZI7_CYAP4
MAGAKPFLVLLLIIMALSKFMIGCGQSSGDAYQQCLNEAKNEDEKLQSREKLL